MIESITITKGQKLTEEQINEVQYAASQPIVFDEDSPELSLEMLSKFKRVNQGEAVNI